MEMKEAACVHKEDASVEKEGLLQSIRVEMVKIREENETLKATLGQLINEYKSLEVHYHSIMQQKGTNKNLNLEASKDKESIRGSKDHEDLVLSLNSKYNSSNNVMIGENARNPNSEDSFDQEPKDKEKETWSSPSKTTKKSNGEVDGDDQETAQAPTVKRARVSVRARCDAPTMNDGCQWRKYGQKIAKGNPCPRGYYRCTVVTGCPVRKQVQRCAEDPAILITTYEGTHNHPLPDAATAMASTTSAAASMLLSGSTSSTPVSTDPYLNHHLPYTNHMANVYPSHTLYTSHSYPTITLDLTKPTPSPHAAALPAFNPYNPKGTLNHNAGLLLGQSYLPSGTITAPNLRPEQSVLTDTLAKAIATNPNFQSVLAAALTSYVGGGEEAKCQAPSRHGLSLDHGLKWGEHLALGSKHSSDANVTGVSQNFATRSGSLFLDSGTAPVDKNKYLT